jgi:voltage-gated potassium channel
MIGTVGYWLIGGGKHSFTDCLYMTVITITTVGFSEIVEVRGNALAEIFTMLIAFGGIGSFLFILSNITALIVEGEINETLKRRKMEKTTRKFGDHYIICGAGKVGTHILNELYTTGRKVVVIDNSPDTIADIREKYPDLTYFKADAEQEEVLIKAGIKKAKGVFASTGDDNQNLVISLTSKFINSGVRVVARCVQAANQTKMKKAGADAVISENYIAGMRMASEMVRPAVVNFLDKMLTDKEKNLRVEEIAINQKYEGKSIADLALEKFPGTLLLAVVSGDRWTYNPNKDDVIQQQSKIVVITSSEVRQKLKSLM